MLNADARSLILSAVAHRLAEIGDVPVAPIRAAANGGGEDELRWLMVQALPKLEARQDDAEFRQQVCERLSSLVPCAADGDLRYLDAMNVYYEETARLNGWRAERGWPGVLVSYRRALIGFAASVTSGARPARAAAVRRNAVVDSRRRGGFDRQPDETLPREVLVLADDLLSGLTIERAVRRVSGLDVHVLVCNNQARPAWRFWAGRLRDVARTGLAGMARAFALLCVGRLHVRGDRLHDEGAVAWLGRRRFWIGLHAMGVIYRQRVLRQFTRGVLNAHIGLLPEYRGRSVMEWSILAGDATGITVFFMDEGIDTGADIVLRREIELPADGTAAAKRHLFHLCPEAYGHALDEFVLSGRTSLNSGGRRYYVMSGTLLSVVDEVLRRRGGVVNAARKSLQKADVWRRLDELPTGIAV